MEIKRETHLTTWISIDPHSTMVIHANHGLRMAHLD